MDWSKGICKIVLQKCTNYWMDYYNIETRANPSLAGSTSGDGTYLDGDIATISLGDGTLETQILEVKERSL